MPNFCMSSSVKPLLEFIHRFRLKVAPPEDSRAYRRMTDLKYIQKRLDQVETDIKKQLFGPAEEEVQVDHIGNEQEQPQQKKEKVAVKSE